MILQWLTILAAKKIPWSIQMGHWRCIVDTRQAGLQHRATEWTLSQLDWHLAFPAILQTSLTKFCSAAQCLQTQLSSCKTVNWQL